MDQYAVLDWDRTYNDGGDHKTGYYEWSMKIGYANGTTEKHKGSGEWQQGSGPRNFEAFYKALPDFIDGIPGARTQIGQVLTEARAYRERDFDDLYAAPDSRARHD